MTKKLLRKCTIGATRASEVERDQNESFESDT